MGKLSVLNIKGEKTSDISLNKELWAIEPNDAVLYDAITLSRNSLRQGTASTKTRSEVSGGGRKPWRQKGTGRARQGTIRAPQWRGGGVVFAPTPRSYNLKVNKKVVRLAMRCALTEKVKENNFIAVNEIKLESFKTKGLVEVLKALNANGKVLVVTKDVNGNVELAGRNLPNVSVIPANHVSVYQMMNANVVVMTQDAVAYYEEVLN